MQELTFDRERLYKEGGFDVVVGVDEAGRGPLAGPVVAAAAVLKDAGCMTQDAEPEWALVRDSKTLSEKQRDRAFEFVHEQFHVGIGIVHSETIDRINILEATFLAMKSAFSELKIQDTRCKMQNTLVLVDGNMTIPNLSFDQEAVVGGDGLVRSIAAASIVAKVTRDRMMLEYDRQYPVYGFAKHKGYGTAAHMGALRKHGASPIHRMSFKPVYYSIPENVNRNLLSRKRR